MPGESPAVFGDALRRLAAAATYLYQDGPRYWYATQPTVTKLAEDRAEQLKRDPDKVAQELDERLRADLRKTGDFIARPSAAALGRRRARRPRRAAGRAARRSIRTARSPAARPRRRREAILESRGNTPRLYRNTLVFLAADKARLQDLDEAVRRYLAWESILAEKEALNLDPHQVRQAETQKQAADGAVTARLPETYQWLLVPEQANAAGADRVAGDPALRAATRWRCGRARSSGATSSLVTSLRLDDPAQAAGRRAAVARRPRRGQAARRGLRALPLPAAARRTRGAGAGDPRRRGAADLADRTRSPTPRATTRARRATGDCAADRSCRCPPTARGCW